MNISNQLLIFNIDGTRYAVHLHGVVRVIPAVEVTPLPEGPEIVTGVINVQGQIIPILNIRRKFRHHERAAGIDDIIVIARGAKWTVAFDVDAVEGVMDLIPDEIIPAGSILPDMEYTEGVAKIRDNIVFLHDIDKALSFEDKARLGAAMEKGGVSL